MKFKIVTVVVATAALSFAAAGSAAAQPLGHSKSAPPQVTGLQLATGLLPLSDIGDDFMFAAALNSGDKLQSTHAKEHVPSLSCADFETGIFISDFGDTAGAAEKYTNPDWISTYPDTILQGYEEVLQFAATTAATTLYNQAYAKYVACPAYVQGAVQVNTLSVSKTTVSGDQAFAVNERYTKNGFTYTLYSNTLYVVAGTNVYILFDLSGTNDEPSPTLMHDLILRVQALYPHRK